MYTDSVSQKNKFTLQSTMVANQYLSQSSNRRRIKQPASIPFLWEVRPGLPKKDWRHIPSISPVNPTALPPVKLIASVPFQWEEMPGIPLPCFPQAMPEAVPLLLLPPPPTLVDSQSPSPTVYSQNIGDNADEDGCDGDDEKDEMNDSYLDAWGFEIDEESFSSAPSLLANRLIPTSAISNAVPVEDTGLIGRNSLHLQQAPCSPTHESGSSTSSSATGNTSLVEAPLLERLFPLLLRKSSSLEKLGCEKGTHSKDLEPESDHNLVVKRPLTLGEQILISRRRSYHRKAILMRDQNHSMEFMKKSVLGCCMVGGGNRIKRLQGMWKNQLQLTPS